MRHHELIGSRDAKEVGDAVRLVTNDLKGLARFEGFGHHNGTTGMQHRIGVAIESAGMEQRQHH